MSTEEEKLTVGECYSYEQLTEGSLVMWIGAASENESNWIGMITNILIRDQDTSEPLTTKKYIVWFDGDSYECERWGEEPKAKDYMYLGRLHFTAQDYLKLYADPVKVKKKKG